MFIQVLNVVLYSVVVLIAILLIALILVQPSKSGGFGSAFGGLGESVFGAQAMGHLSKVTVVFISLFFVLTLALAVISGHERSLAGGNAKTIMSTAQNPPAAATQDEKKADPAPATSDLKSSESTNSPNPEKTNL